MIIAFFFFLLLFVIGIFFIANAIEKLTTFSNTEKWVRLEGEITFVRNDGGDWIPLGEKIEKIKSLEICYEFTYNGSVIQSNRISPSETKVSPSNNSSDFYAYYIQDFYDSMVANPKVHVWINPKNVRESILINNPGQYYYKILLGLVLVVWSLGFSKFVFEVGYIDLSSIVKVVEEKSDAEIQAFDDDFYGINKNEDDQY